MLVSVTKDQLRAGLKMTFAVAEAIREAGEIPSGQLYALVMAELDLAAYERLLGVLVGAGLINRGPNHLLKWVGPIVPGGETVPSKRWTEHAPTDA